MRQAYMTDEELTRARRIATLRKMRAEIRRDAIAAPTRRECDKILREETRINRVLASLGYVE